jgi:hypothetical protein
VHDPVTATLQVFPISFPMMLIRYERDEARRRVVVTVEGAFQTIDMLTVIERQRAEDTRSGGMLLDLRRMTGHPTRADLRELMGQAAAQGPVERPCGPIAILVTDPILYGVACTYAALGHSKLVIEVFRDIDEAALWLAAEGSS